MLHVPLLEFQAAGSELKCSPIRAVCALNCWAISSDMCVHVCVCMCVICMCLQVCVHLYVHAGV